MGWNGSDRSRGMAPEPQPPAKPRKGGLAALSPVAKLILAGSFLIACGVGFYYCSSRGNGSATGDKAKSRGRIEDVGKGRTKANVPSQSTEQLTPKGANSGTNALTRLEPPKIRPEYPRTNADGSVTKIMKDGTTYRVMPRSKNWKKQHPFKHKLEMQLSWYVVPGEAAPPMLPVTYTEKEILDALMDKVEITDDDDDDMIMRKEAVQEMKGELRKWIKDGGDVEGYIKDLAHRQQMEFETVRETRKMVIDAVKSGDIDLARGLEAKFNEHLKSKGLPTLKFPKVYRDQLNNGGKE